MTTKTEKLVYGLGGFVLRAAIFAAVFWLLLQLFVLVGTPDR